MSRDHPLTGFSNIFIEVLCLGFAYDLIPKLYRLLDFSGSWAFHQVLSVLLVYLTKARDGLFDPLLTFINGFVPMGPPPPDASKWSPEFQPQAIQFHANSIAQDNTERMGRATGFEPA